MGVRSVFRDEDVQEEGHINSMVINMPAVSGVASFLQLSVESLASNLSVFSGFSFAKVSTRRAPAGFSARRPFLAQPLHPTLVV
jgi:hypothetical protein